MAALTTWLVERALEHDKPTLLLQLACDKLRRDQIVRPGITRLERLVATAREQAHAETYRRLTPLLTSPQHAWLDRLLVPEPSLGRTGLAWLRQEAVSHAASQILMTLERIRFLVDAGVPHWTFTDLTPNRVKWLAQVGWRSTPQQFQRMPSIRRYPCSSPSCIEPCITIPISWWNSLIKPLGLIRRCPPGLGEFRKTSARSPNDALVLFQALGQVLLDTQMDDTAVRAVSFARIPEAHLARGCGGDGRNNWPPA